jgi:diguanylate cyclase (GGDEF)-like protein
VPPRSIPAERFSNTTTRILQEVNAPIVLTGHTYHPGCSIGVSVYPDAAQSVAHLIRQADVALYQAKASGKGRTRFFRPLPEDRID